MVHAFINSFEPPSPRKGSKDNVAHGPLKASQGGNLQEICLRNSISCIHFLGMLVVAGTPKKTQCWTFIKRMSKTIPFLRHPKEWGLHEK